MSRSDVEAALSSLQIRRIQISDILHYETFFKFVRVCAKYMAQSGVDTPINRKHFLVKAELYRFHLFRTP